MFVSAQESSTGVDAAESMETQDITSNITKVSDLSEGAGVQRRYTTSIKSIVAKKYYSVIAGRKTGIFTNPDEY